MTPEILAQFKNRLEEMQTELARTLESNAEDAATVQLDSSIGRLSRMDAIQSQQIALSMKTRQQQALMRVKAALEAVRNGTYGQCRRCKGPIAEERLEAQPDAVVCVGCANQGNRRS